MGEFYANVSVATTDLDVVRSVLTNRRRNAGVVVGAGWSVVADRENEPDPMLARALSAAARAPALLVVVDSFRLFLAGYADGWPVAQFDVDGEGSRNGDPEAFRALLAPDADPATVRAAFLDTEPDWGPERHGIILGALGLRDDAVAFSWRNATEEHMPPYTEIVTAPFAEDPFEAALREMQGMVFEEGTATAADAAAMPGLIAPGAPMLRLVRPSPSTDDDEPAGEPPTRG